VKALIQAVDVWREVDVVRLPIVLPARSFSSEVRRPSFLASIIGGASPPMFQLRSSTRTNTITRAAT